MPVQGLPEFANSLPTSACHRVVYFAPTLEIG